MSVALKALSTWLTPSGFVRPDTPLLRKRYTKLREAIEQELNALENRATAVRCAHADLLGAEQAFDMVFEGDQTVSRGNAKYYFDKGVEYANAAD